MMRKIANILILCCLAMFAKPAAAQDTTAAKGFELSLDKDTILIGDQLTLNVKFKYNPKYQATFPQIKDTIVPGVELVRDLGIDTIRNNGNIKEYIKHYLITSFDSGHYYIMFPILLENPDDKDNPDTLMSNIVQFHVNTIPVDTLTYQMFDIKAPIEYPVTFDEVWPWALGAILLIALIVAGIIIYKRWKNNQPIFGKAKVKIPPHILAFKELSLLKTEKLWQQGKVKSYYTKITDILRTYIGDRFGISTMEKTSDEILNDIKKNKIDEMYSYDKLREMFYTADLVKFAKYIPAPDENETSFSTAFEFVSSTQPKIEENQEDAEQQIQNESTNDSNKNNDTTGETSNSTKPETQINHEEKEETKNV